jgi:hypothetical protein
MRSGSAGERSVEDQGTVGAALVGCGRRGHAGLRRCERIARVNPAIGRGSDAGLSALALQPGLEFGERCGLGAERAFALAALGERGWSWQGGIERVRRGGDERRGWRWLLRGREPGGQRRAGLRRGRDARARWRRGRRGAPRCEWSCEWSRE